MSDSKQSKGPLKGQDTTQGGNVAQRPLGASTEASSLGPTSTPPSDFPISYEVSKRILDYNDPQSLIEYSIHLFGPDGEDFGELTYTQDLEGLGEQSVDDRGEELAQEAAQNLYDSPQFQTLLQVAPKRIHTPDPNARIDALTERGEQLVEKVDSLQSAIEALRQQCEAIAAMQQQMGDWLTQFYSALTTE